jgi:serine/threonine protein kinase
LVCHYFNLWFPWLIISGAQVPCALAVGLTAQFASAIRPADAKAVVREKMPVTPGYKLVQPPIGKGAYGKVWLARNRAGQWRALKAVYLAHFKDNVGPFEREFAGITRYQPLSGQHPGLLNVEFVSERRDGYFYYVMELADSLTPDWQRKPVRYQPHDLAKEQARWEGKRLPVRNCIQIGIALAEALEFLHRQGITHRDIKPQNVVFVNGRPKLADWGLTTHIRPEDQPGTIVGTPGFMPPPPETPGTALADIFSLGMVMYVIATGKDASAFPEISTQQVAGENSHDFMLLNAVILKACQPESKTRIQSAEQFKEALKTVWNKIGST